MGTVEKVQCYGRLCIALSGHHRAFQRLTYSNLHTASLNARLPQDLPAGGRGDSKGASPGAGAEAHHHAGAVMAAMSSDLDGFTTKLNAILQADLTHAAAAAGPLEARFWPALLCSFTFACALCCSAHSVPPSAAAAPLPHPPTYFPPLLPPLVHPQVAPNLMQQLGAVLATEGGPGLPGSEIDAILKNLKGLQEQVALLDRMQNIR